MFRPAISRYGARVFHDTEDVVARCRARGEFIQGPAIAEFEDALARRVGAACGVATAYGRMAFYYMVKALGLPPGSEIICPSLTFWVVPELARAAGLTVVFADVDPATFTMDPRSVERLITDRTRAIVPTHLYGLACDMDPLLEIAARHGLAVIEDCAHALGATYKGRQVGTFGAGALFSFQTLKPLNCYGGGMAILQDRGLADRVRASVDALPWPSEKRVRDRLLVGRLQRIFIKPWVFSISLFPVLWVSALIDANPDVFLWETIRSLDPLPDAYTERFPNVQAAIGLEALKHVDGWTASARAHAEHMTRVLGAVPGVRVPAEPPGFRHVYYQYCAYGPAGVPRDGLVVRCVRRGIDIETLHVDVPPDMPLFAGARAEADGARRASEAIQIPVYSSLSDEQVARVAGVVRDVLAGRA
ncbi:MAG TPA: aminotransferase class I/II-fold pyridoxal phosphate-dependent enzyme [Vicinamibacterales bacterium]|jgi:dTDP-4-amino-4,6-dideoxygalactose transaminase|nr:aminotransferase class I/II-fold pyridoxal phosphate-dependent enzyme [Vicinamibacterales bacterium]